MALPILLLASFGAFAAGGTYGGNVPLTVRDYKESWNGKAGKQVINKGVRVEWFADACGVKDGKQLDPAKCSVMR